MSPLYYFVTHTLLPFILLPPPPPPPRCALLLGGGFSRFGRHGRLGRDRRPRLGHGRDTFLPSRAAGDEHTVTPAVLGTVLLLLLLLLLLVVVLVLVLLGHVVLEAADVGGDDM